MIDITVSDDKTVTIEMKTYYLDYSNSINIRDEMIKMMLDIIEKIKYSGETISLWKVINENKILMKRWH